MIIWEHRPYLSDLAPIDSPETFAGWHMPWPRFEVDWTRAALVLIDMQNYGCNPDVGPDADAVGAVSGDRAATTCRALRRLRSRTRGACSTASERRGRRVVFTRHGPLLADGSDMIARRRRRDVEALASTGTPALWHRGTFEHEVIERWLPRPASS